MSFLCDLDGTVATEPQEPAINSDKSGLGAILASMGSGSGQTVEYIDDHGVYDEEMEELRSAAEEGDVDAQYRLAVRLLNLAEDIHVYSLATEGQTWLHKAATGGHSGAMQALANVYSRKKEPRKAMMWLRKAVEKDNPEALCDMAFLIMTTGEEGSPPDVNRAEELYLRAASAPHNHPRAQWNLAMINLRMKDPPNEAEAKLWLEKAAEQGHREAIDDLENRFAEGYSLSWGSIVANGFLLASLVGVTYVGYKIFWKKR